MVQLRAPLTQMKQSASESNCMTRRKFSVGVLGLAGTMALPFPTPKVAQAKDGFLEIIAGPSSHRLYGPDAEPSDLWTYNGTLPGPEIRAQRGERIQVRLINNLPEPTSIHWHGIRIANAMDGVAGLTQDPVPPGGTFEYDFVAPDAGTYWYHAHNKSWNQVGRGLYGPLIIEEETSAYDRDHDLTLIMDDWRLGDQGRLDLASFGSLMDWSHAGRLGNWLTVNGTSKPKYHLTAGEMYRIRLINTSNARILELDPAAIGGHVIAYDGQALAEPKPISATDLRITPAQRVDLLVVPEPGRNLALVEVSSGTPFTFCELAVAAGSNSPAVTPALPPNKIPEPDIPNARRIVLDMTGGAMGQMGQMRYKGKQLTRDDIRNTGQVWAFNGIANLDAEPLFSARRGETILIETVNNTAWPHAMHVHGHHFRILDENEEPGPWRDTFFIDRQDAVKTVFSADNPGKWLLHCHMLEHAAAGMTTWFIVE